MSNVRVRKGWKRVSASIFVPSLKSPFCSITTVLMRRMSHNQNSLESVPNFYSPSLLPRSYVPPMRTYTVCYSRSAMLTRLEMMRLAAWICVATLAVLSLWPGPTVFRTGFGAHFEHVFAYAVASVVVALGYNELGLARIVAVLLTIAALLEHLQRYAGRHAEFSDFLFSSTGVFIGVVAFALTEFLIKVGRWRA
jgi:hypothetical protein